VKAKFIQTDNVRRLQEAVSALEHREEGVPGLGLILGCAGFGKTKSVQWHCLRSGSVYLRAKRTWTTSWMLDEICNELNILTQPRVRDKFVDLRSAIMQTKSTIFIDEADYLVIDRKLLDTIRDLHDETNIPMVLIGMDEIQKKIMRHHQFWSRVSQQVIYYPLSQQEIMLLGAELCGLAFEESAAEKVVSSIAGNFRDVIVALSHLERMAKANNTDKITPKMTEVVIKTILKRKVA
jgi:DNA transposition AAA+ family ATPase